MRNYSAGMQNRYVRSPSFISLLLDAGAYERRHLIYVVAHGRSTGVVRCVRAGVVRVLAYAFTGTGVLLFLLRAY